MKIWTDYEKNRKNEWLKWTLIYTSYLFYSAYPPSEFVSTAKRYKDGVLLKADAWGKFQIRDISWPRDLTTPHTLIVALPQDVPANTKIITEIYEPTTYNVLSLNEQVVSSEMHIGKYVIISADQNIGNKNIHF